jgi:hypothetical protein
MMSTLCTPETVADEVLAHRRELNHYAASGVMSPACKDLNIHESEAMVAFQTAKTEHGDFLQFVSDQLAKRAMNPVHTVAFRIHPVTNERVYATAGSFAVVEPLQEERHEYATVVRSDVWNGMPKETRQGLMDVGKVVVTSCPSNETLRAAGFRDARTVSTLDDVPAPQETDVDSGPVAFMDAMHVRWHDDHYCVADGWQDKLPATVRALCKQRGIKAGILVVPHGKCAATVSAESLDSVVARIFPSTSKAQDVSDMRSQIGKSRGGGEVNMQAQFPADSRDSDMFAPMPYLDMQLDGDRWTTKNTFAAFNGHAGAWTLKRTT